MKKIILTLVALVLLVSCVLYHVQTNGISAGSGTSSNEKIESVEDLAELLGFLNEFDINSLSLNDSDLLSSSLSASEKSASKRKGGSYDSFTVTLNSTYYYFHDTSSSWEGGSSYSSSKTDVNRELVIYYTEDAVLFNSKGYSSSSSNRSSSGNGEYDSSSSASTTAFNVQVLYMDGDFFVNFKNYSYASDTSCAQIKNKYTYQWIEMPEEYAIGLINFSSDSVTSLSDILFDIVDTDYVDEDEKIFSLDESDFEDIAEDLEKTPFIDFEYATSDLKVDLSSPSTPHVSWVCNYDYDSSEDDDNDNDNSYGNYYSAKQTVDISEDIAFRNIDNTVISFNDDIVTKTVKDEKGYKKLFNIED